MSWTCNIELSTKYRPFSILGLELGRNNMHQNMHKSSLSLEKYAGVVLLRPEYAGVSSGVEKIAPDFCRSKKIYSGRSSVWSPLLTRLWGELGIPLKLERAVGKFWVGKSEVRKFRFKLKCIDQSWKVFNEVFSYQNFPISAWVHSFQFQSELSNLRISNFSFFSNNPLKLHSTRELTSIQTTGQA